MLVEFFCLCALFFSILGWGTWAKFFLSINNDSISLSSILGLAVLSIVSCCISFFTPLGFGVEMVLLCLSVIPYLLRTTKNYRVKFPKDILKSGWFCFFCVLTVLTGCYSPFLPDHFVYYVSSLNWLNQYGIIRGVADVDWTLGQMSFLHILQACFDNTIDVFQRINVLICVIYIFYIFEKRAFTLLLFLPLCFLFLQSPSPDFLVIVFSLLVVNELVFVKNKDYDFPVLLIVSSFIFVVKPIAFWVPMWVFIMMIFKERRYLVFYKNYVVPGILVILFLVKNILTSSVLLFPMTVVSFKTDWIPDFRILKRSDEIALIGTYHQKFSLQQIHSFSIWERISHWFSFHEFYSVLHYFILAVVIVFGIFSLLKRRFIFYSLWAVIVINLVFIFSFSGQYRFMLHGITVLLFVLLNYVKSKQKVIMATACCFCLISATILSFPSSLQKNIPGFYVSSMMQNVNVRCLLIPQKYVLKKYRQERLGNLNFNISIGYPLNFDTPAPAMEVRLLRLYYMFKIFPQMKDPSDIRKGFYMRNLSDREMEELSVIIKSNK